MSIAYFYSRKSVQPSNSFLAAHLKQGLLSMTTPVATNVMRDQILSLPELIREQTRPLEKSTRKVLTTPEMFAVRQIVLTGCGDSYISALAVERAFVELTGIHTQALTAMQAARFTAGAALTQYPHNPLVIAVSSSGEVARVIEAVKNYREHGALTLAVSRHPESRLALQAERIVPVTIPSFPSAPGVRSYIASLLPLYLLAIRIGEVRGRYTQDTAQEFRRGLQATADVVQSVIDALDGPLQKLADTWSGYTNFELLGSGSDRAVAAYGAAKLLEAVGAHALHEDVEEWVHLQYFVADAKNTGTFIISSSDSAASRVQEIEAFMQTLQRPYLIFTDALQANRFQNVLAVPGAGVHPMFTPLVYSVPVALFAAHLAQRVNAIYGRGAQGQWADCKNGMTTRNSTIV